MSGTRRVDSSGGLGGLLRSLLDGIPWSESADDEEILHLEPPLGRSLVINNANGKTCIIGEDRPDIQVRARKHGRAESDAAARHLVSQIQLRTDYVGDSLEVDVEIPTKWNRHGSANLEIRMPRELAVSVTAANGKVSLEGLRGSVTARSSNGSLRIVDVRGDVEAFTSNAPVSCSCTFGNLICRSSNGKIKLHDHCGSVDASTSNGLIHAALGALGEAGAVLTTSNGRIVLELPEHVDAEVDIRVDNGVIRSERNISREKGDTNGRVRGRIGQGGAPIRLRTSNGTVSLR